MQVLFRTVASKHPTQGLIAHLNQGSQYYAHDYHKLLQQFGMIASMNRRGLHDNASMESFRRILKNELVHYRRFKTQQQARQTGSASRKDWAIYYQHNLPSKYYANPTRCLSQSTLLYFWQHISIVQVKEA